VQLLNKSTVAHSALQLLVERCAVEAEAVQSPKSPANKIRTPPAVRIMFSPPVG
jgi:hypothetical protein